MELFATNNAAAQRYHHTAVVIRIRGFLQVTVPALCGTTHGEAAGERNELPEPSAGGNELEEAHAALGAGRYKREMLVGLDARSLSRRELGQ